METSTLLYLFFSLFVVVFLRISHLSVEAQQTYSDRQLNCYNNINYMNGYFCNSVQLSCEAYLSFRSNFPYNSPAAIGFLLGSEPSLIAEANDISNYDTIPTDTQILIPVNCSCSGPYYQYNTFYKLSGRDETYFTVANNTYQGLTTCQAMMAQNSCGDRNLTVGLNLVVPLRCACPTSNQAAAGIEYLLTYMITWDDTVSSIAELFGVERSRRAYWTRTSCLRRVSYSLSHPFLFPSRAGPAQFRESDGQYSRVLTWEPRVRLAFFVSEHNQPK